MSYLTQSHANRPAAIIGVVGIHAGLGALVVLGLTVGGVLPKPDSGPIITYDHKDPPPPPPTEPAPKTEPSAKSVIYTPPVPDILLPQPNFIETTLVLPPMSDEIQLTIDPATNLPGVGTGPETFQPTQVSPRNDPSRWLTDNDYRSIWIRKEMFGTASFMLDIGENGRVENCSITKSTGHSALNQATCKLIAKRARFSPAQNASGEPAKGIYSSSIRWVLPD